MGCGILWAEAKTLGTRGDMMKRSSQKYDEWEENGMTFTQKVTATTADGCEMVMHYTTTVTEVSPSGRRSILATGIGSTHEEAESNARRELRTVLNCEM